MRRRDPGVSCIPLVVISAASRDLLREAGNLGADACVEKPFDLDGLTAVVRSILSNGLAGDSGGDRPKVVWALLPRSTSSGCIACASAGPDGRCTECGESFPCSTGLAIYNQVVRPTLPADLTQAQLDGRACVRCGDEQPDMRPVEAWSEQSAQLFECIDAEACHRREEA